MLLSVLLVAGYFSLGDLYECGLLLVFVFTKKHEGKSQVNNYSLEQLALKFIY